MSTTINSPGGFFTPNEIRSCALAAYSSNQAGFYLGERQQIIVPGVNPDNIEFKKLSEQIKTYPTTQALPNIICSHASGALAQFSDWAYNKDAYQEALNSFDFSPEISVALIAMGQHFSSGLCSQLNFIASEQEHYWHLILRLGDKTTLLPILFLTEEISIVTKLIDETLKKEAFRTSAWFTRLLLKQFNSAPKSASMTRSIMREGFKEGFIEMPTGRYSLNIYPDKGLFPWQHIEALSALAHTRNVKRIYPTQTGSLLIKHIKKADLPLWKQLLGKLSVTLRHSEENLSLYTDHSNKTNSKLADKLTKKLLSKDYSFHAQSISLNQETTENRAVYQIHSKQAFLSTSFSLSQKLNFDPREMHIEKTKHGLSFSELIVELLKANKEFYSTTHLPTPIIIKPSELCNEEDKEKQQLYECQDCLSHYSSQHGDPEQGIAKDTLFAQLPESWCCPLCEAPKEEFKPYAPSA